MCWCARVRRVRACVRAGVGGCVRARACTRGYMNAMASHPSGLSNARRRRSNRLITPTSCSCPVTQGRAANCCRSPSRAVLSATPHGYRNATAGHPCGLSNARRRRSNRLITLMSCSGPVTQGLAATAQYPHLCRGFWGRSERKTRKENNRDVTKCATPQARVQSREKSATASASTLRKYSQRR